MIILVLKPVPKLRVCHPQNHVPNHGSSLPFYKNFTLNLKHVKNMQPFCWQHLVAPSTGCRYSLQANARSLCSWGSDAKGLDFSFLTSHTRVYPVSPPTGWTAVQFWHSPRELVSHTTSYRLRPPRDCPYFRHQLQVGPRGYPRFWPDGHKFGGSQNYLLSIPQVR